MSERKRRRALRRCAAGLAVGASLACASERARETETQAGSAAVRAEASSGDARSAELEAAIGRDREALRRFVSEQGATPEGQPLHANPELREIARRLPALQQELRELRRARASRGAEPPPQPPQN
jgi:hypothetical protein